jgi:riboflavin biosynthesis pyrimidine reductase
VLLPDSFNWDFYQPKAGIVANFVVSSDGKWQDERGSSRGISNELDRELLVHLRGHYRAVLVGGNTARRESYKLSNRFETFVVTSPDSATPGGLTRVEPVDDADLAAKVQAITSANGGLIVEAGPRLLTTLLKLGLISKIYLTIVGDGGDTAALVKGLFDLNSFEVVATQSVSNTHFQVIDPG